MTADTATTLAFTEGYNQIEVNCTQSEIIQIDFPVYYLKGKGELIFKNQFEQNCILVFDLDDKTISIPINFGQMHNIDIDGHAAGLSFDIKIKDSNNRFSILQIGFGTEEVVDKVANCAINFITVFTPLFVEKLINLNYYLNIEKIAICDVKKIQSKLINKDNIASKDEDALPF